MVLLYLLHPQVLGELRDGPMLGTHNRYRQFGVSLIRRIVRSVTHNGMIIQSKLEKSIANFERAQVLTGELCVLGAVVFCPHGLEIGVMRCHSQLIWVS